MDESNERQKVLDAIDAAFGSLEYPGIELVSDPNSDEGVEAAIAFQQRHWRNFTADFLVPQYMDSLNFLTAKGYEYYLPGYMRVSVIHLTDADMALDNTLYSLDPPHELWYSEIAHFLDSPELALMIQEEGISPLGMTGDEVRSTSKADFERAKEWFLSHSGALTVEEKHAVLMFVEFMHEQGCCDDDRQYHRMTDYYRNGRLPWQR